MWKWQKFSHLFVRFQCDLKKKDIALMEASFSPILRWSPKKQKKRSFVWVLQVFYALHATYESEAPWIAAVYGFWRETKTLVFGGKKRQNSQNFKAKLPEKNSHYSNFFALIGNTDMHCWRLHKHAHSSMKRL